MCQLPSDRFGSLMQKLSKRLRGTVTKGSATSVWRNLDLARGTSWHLDRSGLEVRETNVAHLQARTLRAESASRSVAESGSRSVDAERKLDDGFDFPPTAYPGRELFTASVFVLLIISLLVWGGWRLISLL
jgi:hypothetical protein